MKTLTNFLAVLSDEVTGESAKKVVCGCVQICFEREKTKCEGDMVRERQSESDMLRVTRWESE